MSCARILLADDHPDMRELVVRLLEREFEIVQVVGDGLAFLQAATNLEPDLCLLDISMPGIDGIRGAAELMQKGFGGKIIMLTVQEDPDFVRAAFESGAMGYVIKSRIGTDLAIAIREVLAGRTFISSSLDYNSNIGH